MGTMRRVWRSLTNWRVPTVRDPNPPKFLGQKPKRRRVSPGQRRRPLQPPRQKGRKPGPNGRDQAASPFKRHELPRQPTPRQSPPPPGGSSRRPRPGSRKPGQPGPPRWQKHVRRRRPTPSSVRRRTQDVLWHRKGLHLPGAPETKQFSRPNRPSVYYYYQPSAHGAALPPQLG